MLTEFFWLAKERKIRTRNNGINKRNILSSLFFKCSFRFQLEIGEFHNDGKDVSFIFLTLKNGETIKILIFVLRMIILMQTLVKLS